MVLFMPAWLASIRLDSLWLFIAIAVVAILALVLALLPKRAQIASAKQDARDSTVPDVSRPRRQLVLVALIAGIVTALLATLAFWLLMDVWNIFRIQVGWLTRIAWSLGLGLAGAGAAVLFQSRRRRPGKRRALGAATLVSAILAVALAINLDAGAVHTVGDLFPKGPVPTFTAQAGATESARPAASSPITEAQWQKPADQPDSGKLYQAQIPATSSGFPARPAYIWLPPAAQTSQPPALPVMVMLAGQPGGPGDLFTAGQFQTILESYAAAHNGLAPIVVVPDQLGTPEVNPLCIDGPAGNSRTYLEQDVPAWILANLPVAQDRTAWTFGGFSQGGTCAYQIGLDQPDRYGSVLSIAGELTPSLGNEANTIAQGFGGDTAKYEQAKPISIMKSHAPYRDVTLFHIVGGNDSWFQNFADQLTSVAKESGITVVSLTSPGTGHDFRTVSYALEQVLPQVVVRSGMVPA